MALAEWVGGELPGPSIAKPKFLGCCQVKQCASKRVGFEEGEVVN